VSKGITRSFASVLLLGVALLVNPANANPILLQSYTSYVEDGVLTDEDGASPTANDVASDTTAPFAASSSLIYGDTGFDEFGAGGFYEGWGAASNGGDLGAIADVESDSGFFFFDDEIGPVDSGHIGSGPIVVPPRAVDAQASFQRTVANNSGGAQQYDFDFAIPGGTLEVGGYDDFSANQASYSISILWRGLTIWKSSASLLGSVLTDTCVGPECVALPNGGVMIGSDYAEVYYSLFAGSLDLGILEDGEFGILEYILEASAAIPGFVIDDPMIYDPEMEYGDEYFGFDQYRYAFAQFGDPNAVTASGTGPTITTQVNANALAVSEPGTLAILSLGLLGLGFMRRRRTA
jgi:PEP-CTERM motif